MKRPFGTSGRALRSSDRYNIKVGVLSGALETVHAWKARAPDRFLASALFSGRRASAPDPDRIVRLWEVTPQGDDHNVVSRGNYLDWREQTTSFDELGAHSAPYGMALTGAGEPSGARVVQMSASAFRVLGISAAMGRIYDTPDLQPAGGDGPSVALVSYGFRQERFGGDTGIVGRVVRLNDQACTILGVLPQSFTFPSQTVQIWVPATFGANDRNERRSHNWHVVARLKTGISGTAAKAIAIAAAAPGAEIVVEPGEYRERLLLRDGVRIRSRVHRGASIRLPGDDRLVRVQRPLTTPGEGCRIFEHPNGIIHPAPALVEAGRPWPQRGLRASGPTAGAGSGCGWPAVVQVTTLDSRLCAPFIHCF